MSGKNTARILAMTMMVGMPVLAVADGIDPVVVKEVVRPKAESKLTIRGGYASSFEEYPFAFEFAGTGLPTRVDDVYEAGYGDGLFGYVAYSNDAMFGRVGGEISLSHHQLSGEDSANSRPDCYIFDAVGLIRNNCATDANTTNETRITSIRVLTSRERASGVQLLAGFGALNLSSDTEVNQSRTDFNSDVSRQTDYTGLGLVAGARKVVPISNKAMLQFEGFAGVYSGDRKFEIKDHFKGDSGETYATLSNKERQTVFSLDLTASIAMPVERIASGGMVEVGLAYTRLFNVMDTSNYNPNTKSVYSGGSSNEDIDALSLFFGLQIPL